MANKKITQLTSLLNKDMPTTSVFPVVDGTDVTTKKISVAELDVRWGVSLFKPPTVRVLAGSGTYGLSYWFTITSGSATAAATYTNNGQTFTVAETIASQTQLRCTSTGAPAASGTLTKTSGTGDTTITFSAFRKPIALDVQVQAGGGGGRGTNGTPGDGGNGGNSTFDTMTAGGGRGGLGPQNSSGNGGTATGGDVNIVGGKAGISGAASEMGGFGGGSVLGFGGPSAGGSGIAATGFGGGGGAGIYFGGINSGGGTGGGYCRKMIANPSATYAYVVGAAGAAGAGSTWSGGAGTIGTIIVTEIWN